MSLGQQHAADRLEQLAGNARDGRWQDGSKAGLLTRTKFKNFARRRRPWRFKDIGRAELRCETNGAAAVFVT
jgi:hypothetical protein